MARRAPPPIEDNISYNTTLTDLRRLFDRYGEIGDIHIPREKYSGQSKGFAFVRFYSRRDADHAIDRLDGRWIDGREIRCAMARYERPVDERGHERNVRRGGGGGGRDRSRSRSPRRRRQSRSPSRSRSRSPPPKRVRSPSRSRSRSPGGGANGAEERKSRSRSPSRSRSRSVSLNKNDNGKDDSGEHERSPSRSASPVGDD